MYKKLDTKIKLFNIAKNCLSEFELENWQNNFSINYTHNSTAIEGNSLTLIQTKVLLEEKVTPAELPIEDVLEVLAHNEAFNYIKEQLKENRQIDEEFIKDVHEKVMPTQGIGGMYRNVPVYIAGAMHVPPTHEKVREQMKFFAIDLREKEKQGINPVEKAAWLHAQVVKIHPFQDGNGRTCRLLMNYSLMQDGLLPVNIKKNDKVMYFNVLEEYATENNLKPFAQFVENNLNEELKSFLQMYKEHMILEKDSTSFA